MNGFAHTPAPPYYAVIFTSLRTEGDQGYGAMAERMVELATLEWVSWFNHHRLLGPIGYIPPAEAEANYHRQLASQSSMVAV